MGMKITIRKTPLLLALMLAAAPACAANGFKAVAKELTRAAKNAGLGRVAVLPFTPADGSSAKDGWNIAEKLTTQIVRLGKVQAVERSMLSRLMEEHHLAQTGLVDQAALKRMGKVLSVEAIVTGSFVTLGRETMLNARLIDIETGVIMAAVERQVEREWFDASQTGLAAGHLAAALWVPAPEFTVEAPPIPEGSFLELRDAPSDEVPCERAAERVDDMEREILDLKARHWAARLKEGVASTQLKVNPGSTITDPELKKEFYSRMKYWYGRDSVPELSPSEVRRFVSVDEQAYSLYRECGI